MTVVSACAVAPPHFEAGEAPSVFYTVTGEIALSRHEPRLAAIQYAAAAEEGEGGAALLRRAVDVTADCLQPTLEAQVADDWLHLDPKSLDAHRAAARAALDLHRIEDSAAQYLSVLRASPLGMEAELVHVAIELNEADNVFGAHQVADRIAAGYPASAAALRLQASMALRADDATAAVGGFAAAAALAGGDEAQAREVLHAGWRARVLAGDVEPPLAAAHAAVVASGSDEDRLTYATLLLAAGREAAAEAQLRELNPMRPAALATSTARTSTVAAAAAPTPAVIALRLLAFIDLQHGRLQDASVRFAQLLTTGWYVDDAVYHLGLIAQRHGDVERALHLFAEVQRGENVVPAMLHAASLLNARGEADAADDLLDQLVIDEPRSAPAILAARAHMYAESGQPARAMDVLTHAEIEYPDNADLRYARASTYEQRGDLRQALRELERVAKSRPGDPAALNALGYTLADHGRRLSEARGMIERAHAAAPQNPAINDSMGWVNYRQGHAAEAIDYLQRAYLQDPGADIAAHLGEVLWQSGRQTEARRVWAEGDNSDGDHHLLDATRERLHAMN